MVFKIKKIQNKRLEAFYKKSMKELDNFFKINWKSNLPSIFLIPDRKTIDLLKHKKTEKWIVGWANGQNIFLLDPNNYSKESSHKYSEEEYKALLKHELCHLFYDEISKYSQKPRWLDEGIATYLSGQNKFKKIPKKFNKFLDYYNGGGKGIYNESGFAIEILIKKFGKKKILNLIKKLPRIKNKTHFNKEFAKIYGFNLTYKNFNKLL